MVPSTTAAPAGTSSRVSGIGAAARPTPAAPVSAPAHSVQAASLLPTQLLAVHTEVETYVRGSFFFFFSSSFA